MFAAKPVPRIIPVLDIMGGRVVRAVGGRRETYRPVTSRLTPSTDPTEVATAMLDATRAASLYVADLDAIRDRSGPSKTVLDLLRRGLTRVWMDIGIGSSPLNSLRSLPDSDLVCPVVGFETAARPEVVADSVLHAGNRPVALSIDLRDGELLGDWRGWGLAGPRDILGLAAHTAELGVRALIVLDLARVGERKGPATEHVCRSLRGAFPEIELFAGGGVRSWDDVRSLGDAGVDAVLAATALHDGSIKTLGPAG